METWKRGELILNYQLSILNLSIFHPQFSTLNFLHALVKYGYTKHHRKHIGT